MGAQANNLDAMIAADQRRQKLLRMRKMISSSRDELLTFAQYMRPHVDYPDDAEVSTYEIAPHHALIAQKLEALERGDILRLIIDVPPRHGKTELASKTFVPWCTGRHPQWHVITATYSQHFAGDFGRAVRGMVTTPRYANVFPEHGIKKGSAAVERLETEDGGILTFAGRGGGLTGRGGFLIVVDDPLKDRKEADSKTIRDQLWSWWTQVLSTRLMTDEGRILLIQTRWHEDDLVGRITDRHNPSYNRVEAEQWTHVRLPAIAEPDDVLGRKSGEALWPSRFSIDYLTRMKHQDTRGFSALYQGRPSPDEGLFFAPSDIVEYQDMLQLPKELRYYASSDHAVSQEQWSDKSVFLVAGVDAEGDLWIMPDSTLHKLPTDQAVTLMLVLIKKYKPLFWWAERGHITKAIGPFLRKRMVEEQVFCAVNELTPINDKQTRAQSIKGRMAMGKVHFPAWTNWYPEVRNQILTFPAGTKDDFVDALSMLGMGLAMQMSARPGVVMAREYKRGTMGWVKGMTERNQRRAAIERKVQGW